MKYSKINFDEFFLNCFFYYFFIESNIEVPTDILANFGDDAEENDDDER